jgi:hypothetical protein
MVILLVNYLSMRFPALPKISPKSRSLHLRAGIESRGFPGQIDKMTRFIGGFSGPALAK